ncbi:MAG: hypothetical protein ABIT47_04510 [Candidatus Paceibacterota bacterium]
MKVELDVQRLLHEEGGTDFATALYEVFGKWERRGESPIRGMAQITILISNGKSTESSDPFEIDLERFQNPDKNMQEELEG